MITIEMTMALVCKEAAMLILLILVLILCKDFLPNWLPDKVAVLEVYMRTLTAPIRRVFENNS
jgi:hypothetical protein